VIEIHSSEEAGGDWMQAWEDREGGNTVVFLVAAGANMVRIRLDRNAIVALRAWLTNPAETEMIVQAAG